MKRTPLRRKPPADHSSEAGYREWHEPRWGACAVCGRHGLLLRHHVVTESRVRLAGGDPWDLDNSLLLGYYACRCHRDHHQAVQRLPVSKLPPESIVFMVELLGEDQAADYLARNYRVVGSAAACAAILHLSIAP